MEASGNLHWQVDIQWNFNGQLEFQWTPGGVLSTGAYHVWQLVAVPCRHDLHFNCPRRGTCSYTFQAAALENTEAKC